MDQAVDTANKINELSNLITTLRNDAQSEMESTITRINDLTTQIAALNKDIKAAINSGRTQAAQSDMRDEAIKELSGLMEISFFTRGDGVLVIQTAQGVELASEFANTMVFDPTPLSPSTYYPASAEGITVVDPSGNENTAINITESSLGGKLGGLLTLRDETFPRQMAQLDEMAHKLALRMEAQGLRLFTDSSGNIPLDTAPDPTTLPNPTPVSYVGFSSRIEVNRDIIADHSLLQRGTYGVPIQTGSNQILRRVVEFALGSTDFQQAIGQIDLRTSLQAAPNNTLQNWLGLYSENQVRGTADLTAYPGVADILTAGGATVFGTNDNLTITFDDPDYGTGPHVINIDLSAVVPSGINAAQDMIDAITADPDWATAVAEFNASVTIGPNGQLVFDSRSDITIAPAVVNGITDEGFAFLGLVPATTEARDPYFDVRVGNNPPTRITIDPNDDEDDLYAQLAAVPGLALEDFTASADGFLRLRPGNDYLDPDFGGDISIIGGPFQTDTAGINAVIGPGTIPDNLNIITALFGSFSAGPPAEDVSPITDIGYGSQTDGSLAPPIPAVPFRIDLLGPGANISTDVIATGSILDFAQKIVNQHSQEMILVDRRLTDEETLGEMLQTQFLNESGVNIDEEMSHLIVVQTAFAASARVVNAVDRLFEELLNAFR